MNSPRGSLFLLRTHERINVTRGVNAMRAALISAHPADKLALFRYSQSTMRGGKPELFRDG